MIKNKRIFITGGAGFIGKTLVKELCDNNEIVIYDNLSRNSLKDFDYKHHKNISIIQGDILDLDKLKSIIENYKPNIVIHLAAIAGVDTVISNPLKTMRVNMIGTYNLMESLISVKDYLERVVEISTSEVFGTYAYKSNEDDTTNLAPVGDARWTYSVSKLAGEHLCHSYYKELGYPVVTIRPFNIYGPGQVGEGAIHQFVKRAINNEDIEIHGDGNQIRSWCYVDDFVNGVLLSLENDNAIGNVFNIGNTRSIVTIGMLADLVKRLSNSKSKIIYVPKKYVDVELRIPSIDKARELLNYEPNIDLNEGLKKTIEWYRGNKND